MDGVSTSRKNGNEYFFLVWCSRLLGNRRCSPRGTVPGGFLASISAEKGRYPNADLSSSSPPRFLSVPFFLE